MIDSSHGKEIGKHAGSDGTPMALLLRLARVRKVSPGGQCPLCILHMINNLRDHR